MTNKEILEKFFKGEEVVFPLQPLYNIIKSLQEFGYSEDNTETNGGEMDYWITFIKPNHVPIVVSGCVFHDEDIKIYYKDEEED